MSHLWHESWSETSCKHCEISEMRGLRWKPAVSSDLTSACTVWILLFSVSTLNLHSELNSAAAHTDTDPAHTLTSNRVSALSWWSFRPESWATALFDSSLAWMNFLLMCTFLTSKSRSEAQWAGSTNTENTSTPPSHRRLSISQPVMWAAAVNADDVTTPPPPSFPIF